MSRYYSYNDFMSDAFVRADEICQSAKGKTLHEATGLSEDALNGISRMMSYSMSLFSGLVEFIAEHPVIAGVGVTFFLASPIGRSVALVLGSCAVSIVIEICRKRFVILAIDRMCKTYRTRWEEVEGCKSDVDALLDEAARSLLSQLSLL